MLLEELDFSIPEHLIAQWPAEPRDSCRLMHLRADGEHHHAVFSDLPDLLQPGDTLVFNDSRVLPARVRATKPTGANVEVLFLRPYPRTGLADRTGEEWGETWEVLARPSHRLRVGGELVFPGGETVILVALLGEGRWVLAAPVGCSLVAVMEAHGLLPLPPYIKTYPEEPSSYQTIYAAVPGSAAAPTAGLHFTPALLGRLAERGIRSVYVTLHVGLDTFLPIRESVVEDHRIHRESYTAPAEAIQGLRAARQSGERVVAVGTTATRVLETLAQNGVLDGPARGEPVSGSTEIFITPGHRFSGVDALITNLHLPRSSVLALTMAFGGVERIRRAYVEALAMEYRFFSFGDAMLIDGPSNGESRVEGSSVVGPEIPEGRRARR